MKQGSTMIEEQANYCMMTAKLEAPIGKIKYYFSCRYLTG